MYVLDFRMLNYKHTLSINIDIYVHACVHICMCIYTCVNTYTYMYICIYRDTLSSIGRGI